jgi:hypothetical protein
MRLEHLLTAFISLAFEDAAPAPKPLCLKTFGTLR